MALRFTPREKVLLPYSDGVAEKQYVDAVMKWVGWGEKQAVTASKLLKLMGKSDTDANRRQLRHATDWWQEQGVFIAATINGYFRVVTERERKRVVENKETQITAETRRKNRYTVLPLCRG